VRAISVAPAGACFSFRFLIPWLTPMGHILPALRGLRGAVREPPLRLAGKLAIPPHPFLPVGIWKETLDIISRAQANPRVSPSSLAISVRRLSNGAGRRRGSAQHKAVGGRQ
jgi:hypothetical protein